MFTNDPAGGPGPPDGWRKDDELPGNVVEDRRAGTRERAGIHAYLRATVIRVEPWYARKLELDEGQTSYGDEDFVMVEADDKRVEGDTNRVFKVYLDVVHQFGGNIDLPEYWVLNGYSFPKGTDVVATMEALNDAVFLLDSEPWHLDPAGRPDDRPIYWRFGPGAEIFPIGPDGQIDYPGHENIESLERKAHEPDQLIVIGPAEDLSGRVVDRQPRR